MRWVIALCVGLAGCDWVLQLRDRPKPVDAALAAIDAPIPQDAGLIDIGCADGEREALSDLSAYPNIAGCSGAWDRPGVLPAMPPSCGRMAGNTGIKVLGVGCNATDLCAEGWDVCASNIVVRASLPSTMSCSDLTFEANQFFVTRQSGPSGGKCDAINRNDTFGCGSLGVAPDAVTCSPLNRTSGNDCSAIRLSGWRCLEPGESQNIYKIDPYQGGGVLCCRTP